MRKPFFLLCALLILPLTCRAMSTPGMIFISNVGRYALPVVALLETVGRKDDQGTKQFIYALASSQAVTEHLKRLIRERRPNGHDRKSFPSGHASASFSAASFLQRRYGNAFGIPAYLFAGYIGFTRIELDRHYTHDVIAGALLGIAATYIFVKPYKLKQATLRITPRMGDQLGLQASLRW